VTTQPQSHVNGSREKSTVVNVQGGVSSSERRGCDNLIIPEEHPRLRHFRARSHESIGMISYVFIHNSGNS
jgi:hypothetical protein